jgi:cold shock CspA family protein
MSRHLDEPMTERGELATPAAAPPQSNDTPVVATPPAGVPLPLIAHMVARLVSGQKTAASDIPALVETVNAALARILHPIAKPPAAEVAEEITVHRERQKPPRQRPETGRRPGRPRKVEAAPPVEAPAPPPAPRLVRRAEAVASPPAADPAALTPPPATSMVRGVVRWFDPARQTGGLRLTGVPEDVPVEPAVFIAAGVTRLFKGQEIEAQLDRGERRVRVTALRVPGGPATAPTVSGPIAAMGGRRPRVVLVEKKRDAMKRVAARTEAEHLLGPTGTPKPPR